MKMEIYFIKINPHIFFTAPDDADEGKTTKKPRVIVTAFSAYSTHLNLPSRSIEDSPRCRLVCSHSNGAHTIAEEIRKIKNSFN